MGGGARSPATAGGGARLPLLGRWLWPLLPMGSGGEGIWRLGLGHRLLRLLRLLAVVMAL